MQGAHIDSMEDKTSGAVIDANEMLEALAFIIQKVSCEVLFMILSLQNNTCRKTLYYIEQKTTLACIINQDIFCV